MRKGTHATLTLPARKKMLLDVHKRRRIEACGLLIGTIDAEGNWFVEEAYPMCNIFDSPVYFEFAPEDLLVADMTYPNRIIGAYHSHPTGLARASMTDKKNMQRVNVEQNIPWVWFIISGSFDSIPAFLDEQSPATALPAGIKLVAYHHYEQEGLQFIDVRFEAQEKPT